MNPRHSLFSRLLSKKGAVALEKLRADVLALDGPA
jgi:hypothetical protein